MKGYSVKGAGHRAPRKHHVPVVSEIKFPPGVLVAYTDGSTYRSNPGPIGWAVLFVRDNDEEMNPVTFCVPWQLVGAHEHGSSSRAELMGVVWALEHAPHEDLVIRCDSLATVNACLGLFHPRRNLDLWQRFHTVVNNRKRHGLSTHFEHVRGHYQDHYNKRVDRLAAEHLRDSAASQ